MREFPNKAATSTNFFVTCHLHLSRLKICLQNHMPIHPSPLHHASSDLPFSLIAQRTQNRPTWKTLMAITGKPLAHRGRNDFSEGRQRYRCSLAMIAATSTMWDTLSWAAKHSADLQPAYE